MPLPATSLLTGEVHRTSTNIYHLPNNEHLEIRGWAQPQCRAVQGSMQTSTCEEPSENENIFSSQLQLYMLPQNTKQNHLLASRLVFIHRTQRGCPGTITRHYVWASDGREMQSLEDENIRRTSSPWTTVTHVLTDWAQKDLFTRLHSHMTPVKVNHIHVRVKTATVWWCTLRFSHFARSWSNSFIFLLDICCYQLWFIVKNYIVDRDLPSF